jgi:hypothetical protein
MAQVSVLGIDLAKQIFRLMCTQCALAGLQDTAAGA